MKTKRILIGTLVATVCLFLLGFIIYGMLLADTMAANTNAVCNRPPEEMKMWAIFLSNLVSGLVIALIFDWSSTTTFRTGFTRGAVFGFLIAFGFDLSMFSMTILLNGMTAAFIDGFAYAVMMGLSGGIAALAMGKWGGTPATATT